MEKDWDVIQEKYDTLFDKDMTYVEIIKKLVDMKDNDNYEYYVCILCDEILLHYVLDYIYYPKKLQKYDVECRELYLKAVKLFFQEEYFYVAIKNFFLGEKANVEKYLKLWIEEYKKDGYVLNEIDFTRNVMVNFKNAYKGFYDSLAQIYRDNNVDSDIIALCEIIEKYYQCKSIEGRLEVMLTFSSEHQKLVLPKELIAYCYCDLKMWNNALAYLEQIEEKFILTIPSGYYFMMGYCYGKVNAYSDEEKCYKKSIEINPNVAYSRNNMGYSFYKQKRYEEALKLFEECFELNLELDIKYAANNYVRTLLAMGRNKEARDFIDSGKYKVSKAIKDRAKKSDGINYKTDNRYNAPLEDNDEQGEANEISTQKDFISKSEQFSSEKILEDELTARIESGQAVFGLDLKVWRRKGEYGRQYILPTGKRLDLLCEDNEGNIYIIELKKDSGYDDPYNQIVEYVDWFSNNKRFKGKNIYGIICLNAPTDKLLNKVHKDKRIRLFEYQISYTER